MSATEVVADPEEMRRAGMTLLPRIAGQYGAATAKIAAAPTGLAGPSGWDLVNFAYVVQETLATTADAVYDSGVGLCKMAAGYQVTDNVNAEQLPRPVDIDFPTRLDPKLRTL
ncbi:hypothetical protein [Phytomonospora endophytica]|uniref:Uncharacterized protein n=1 Tax=Phytomonospora endophytica TaxID=714109 RepID=A0A841FNJ6_9ACTN|nr:hypothetical protein [Phytomonospora endophytica]MBB6034169.1 hypothetical protein [Phytomonospora endophytica]GIG66561.1 hypothetical protein Pen01_28560 [Phytomonospora endophytica]